MTVSGVKVHEEDMFTGCSVTCLQALIVVGAVQVMNVLEIVSV
jgi:hypothetical protein